jgi:hypothetical protein
VARSNEAFPVTIPEAHEFFLAAGGSPHNDQNTMPCFLKPGLKVHPVDPEIHVAFACQVTLLPLRQFLLPPLFQPAERGGGEPRGIGTYESL